jgi:hypothetical protein
MQLYGGTKCPCTEPQGISLRPSPRTPFDNYPQTECEQLLSEFPLQGLDLSSLFFIVDGQRKRIQPIVWREADRAQSALKFLGKCCLT